MKANSIQNILHSMHLQGNYSYIHENAFFENGFKPASFSLVMSSVVIALGRIRSVFFSPTFPWILTSSIDHSWTWPSRRPIDSGVELVTSSESVPPSPVIDFASVPPWTRELFIRLKYWLTCLERYGTRRLRHLPTVWPLWVVRYRLDRWTEIGFWLMWSNSRMFGLTKIVLIFHGRIFLESSHIKKNHQEILWPSKNQIIPEVIMISNIRHIVFGKFIRAKTTNSRLNNSHHLWRKCLTNTPLL